MIWVSSCVNCLFYYIQLDLIHYVLQIFFSQLSFNFNLISLCLLSKHIFFKLCIRFIFCKYFKITQVILIFYKVIKDNKLKYENKNHPLANHPQITIYILGDIPPVFFIHFTFLHCLVIILKRQKISPLKEITVNGYTDQKRMKNVNVRAFS